MNRRAQVRATVREALRGVALPDSRWHLDVDEFVPDFEGSDQALERLVTLPQYKASERLYVTPDNSTEALRRRALDDGKTVVISTFGQRRGMVLLDPGKIPRERRELASTLDGMERCGVRLGLDDLAELGRLDVVVTGAFAVTEQGIHVDSHADYFDLEWGLLAELGLVVPATPVIAIVHSAQVIDVPLSPEPYEVTVDLIVTAERLVRCTRDLPRPVSITWSDLDGRRVAASAYLSALNERRASASSASSQIAWNRAFEKGPLRA